MAEEREDAGEPEIELKEEEDEEAEADSREGDGVWVREEKWYPSLRRYLASRNCENCYKDGVKVLDMIIRQSRTSHDLLDSKSNGSTTHCSEYSEQPPGIDVTDVVVNKAANLPPTSPCNSNHNKKLMLLPPAPGAELTTPKSKPHNNKGTKAAGLGTLITNTKNIHKFECPPPPPQEEVRCVFCKSPDTRFEHYNNHKIDQPRYRCTKCKQRFTYGGKLRNKRLKLCCSSNKESTDDSSQHI